MAVKFTANDVPKLRGRVNGIGAFLFGLVLLGLALWLTLLLLKNFYGELPSLKSALSFAGKGEKAKIALLKSIHTQTGMPELSSWVNTNLSDWEVYLLNKRLVYQVITSQELANGISGYDLLILPSAICMSEGEKSAVKKFLSAGGSVLATGGVGSRNERGEWLGWDFLSALFGVDVTGEILQEDLSASLTLKGNSPLSNRVPPGFRLEVTTSDRPLAVRVVEPRTTAVGYWYDFRANPGEPLSEMESSCGLVYGEYRKGRFVWVGFGLGAVVGVKFHQIVWDRLLTNTLLFLTREPVGWLNPWPNGYESAEAALLAVTDAEHRFPQALNALKLFNQEGVPATFFLLVEEAEQNPEVSRVIAEQAEVGLHSLGHSVYRWQPYEVQVSRLKEGRERIERLTGEKVRGFRPPEALYDSSTIDALLNLGYEYLCADSLMDRACPNLIRRKEKTLITLPKTARDDYELLIKDSLMSTEELYNALKQDFDRVYEVNGVYTLFLHSQLLCAEEKMPALEQFLKYCKGKDVWFTTCQELADWWKRYENLSLSIKRRGPTRVMVNITNTGRFTVEDLRLFIVPPEPVRSLTLTPELLGTKIPEYEVRDQGRLVVLKVKALRARGSQTIFIDYKRFEGS